MEVLLFGPCGVPQLHLECMTKGLSVLSLLGKNPFLDYFERLHFLARGGVEIGITLWKTFIVCDAASHFVNFTSSASGTVLVGFN